MQCLQKHRSKGNGETEQIVWKLKIGISRDNVHHYSTHFVQMELINNRKEEFISMICFGTKIFCS